MSDNAEVKHLRVMLNTDGTHSLVCPWCGDVDAEVVEKDYAVRYNRAYPEITDEGVLVLNYKLGQSEFEHHDYSCGSCQRIVLLPSSIPAEDILEDWS